MLWHRYTDVIDRADVQMTLKRTQQKCTRGDACELGIIQVILANDVIDMTAVASDLANLWLMPAIRYLSVVRDGTDTVVVC